MEEPQNKNKKKKEKKKKEDQNRFSVTKTTIYLGRNFQLGN
jgi:hypothetical protein